MPILVSQRKRDMVILFVHGMGRSPISGWPMLHRLRQAGMNTSCFGYSTASRNFSAIKTRLVARIISLAAEGDYVVVGHSLGGVLLRAALNSLPAETTPPRHVFLLGSPIHPARLAKRLKDNFLFRLLAGDCGDLLSSSLRMAEIGSLNVPVTSIVGIRGIAATRRYFGEEPNDGVISVSEASDTWISSQLRVSTVHTFLPSSRRIAEIITEKMAGYTRP